MGKRGNLVTQARCYILENKGEKIDVRIWIFVWISVEEPITFGPAPSFRILPAPAQNVYIISLVSFYSEL